MDKTSIFFANPDKPGHVMRSIVALGIVCMLLFAVVGCEASKEASEPDEKEEEAIKDSFSELSLIGTACEWIRYNGDSGYELIIINSDEELRNYIICAEVDDFPTIDFSRYTLLLARGFLGNSCTPDYVKLQQISYGNYELNIDFPLNAADVIVYWHVAIITNKLNDSDNVKLNVTFNGKPMNSVSFTKFSLSGTLCEWQRVSYDASVNRELIIINSDDELRNHLICTEEEEFPFIDFSRYTLLLARGIEGHLVYLNSKDLQQYSSQNYVMNVRLLPALASVITHWHAAIITNKLEGSDSVKLSVTMNVE